jgi:hypothetical protein
VCQTAYFDFDVGSLNWDVKLDCQSQEKDGVGACSCSYAIFFHEIKNSLFFMSQRLGWMILLGATPPFIGRRVFFY